MRKTLNTTLMEPSRLDRAVQSLTGLSRAGVRGVLDHDCVRVNGAPASLAHATLNVGDVVEVTYDPHTRYHEKPAIKDDPAYRILFEDEHLLVVNKAAHVLTVPTPSGKGKTLIDALQRHVDRAPRKAHRKGGQKGRNGRSSRALHVVHRLDLGVSGVMVVAKTGADAASIRNQFASHKPQRLYVAIVNGIVEQRKGTFRSHLATDGTLNRYSTKNAEKGELAVTHYEVQSTAHGATVVRVKLETGRRNQIRVHFAEAGHPVLGDPRYPREGQPPPRPARRVRDGSALGNSRGDRDTRAKPPASPVTSLHPKWKSRRMALHARSLSFQHPATGELMRFETDLPAEFSPFMGDASRRAAKNANTTD